MDPTNQEIIDGMGRDKLIGTNPLGAISVANISHHPSDPPYGLSYRVIRFASGVEVAWDGSSYRSLPRDWRDRVLWVDPIED